MAESERRGLLSAVRGERIVKKDVEFCVCLLCGETYRRPVGCIADLRCTCDPKESASYAIYYDDPNAHALAEARSDDSYQRVVGRPNGGGE